MTGFKLCAAVLLNLFFCFIVNKGFAQSLTECEASIAIGIYEEYTVKPANCSATGTITFWYKGDLNWEFRLNGGTWQPGYTRYEPNSFYNVLAGNHTIYGRNQTTQCTISLNYTLEALPGGEPLINNVTTTEASFCSNNGSISIDATNVAPGGYSDLRYRLNGGTWSSSNTFNNLAGGAYTVEVATSDGRCVSSTTATVPKLARPTINSVTTTASNSCATPNGQIQINATHPNNIDLMYSIDNGVTWSGNALFTNLSPGTYTVAVAISGDESCKVTRTATLGGTSTINITNVSTTAATSCAAPDGRITISASGSGTLYYKIQGGTWQTSNIINGLVPGTYTVLVKNSTGTCEVTYPTPVQVNGTGVVTITSVNTVAPTTCDTALANGQITITAQGGTGLRYSINNGLSFSTSNIFSNLKAGTYNVVVTKSDGSCAVSYPPVVVPAPSGITVQSVQTIRPTICGATNGSITITAAPAGTYQYSINGGQTFQSSATFSNLPQGSYQIVIKSATSACIAYHAANPVTLQPLTCPEICNDGIDNDGVGGVDNCPDATCGLTTMQVQVTQTNCSTNTKGTITVNTGLVYKNTAALQVGDIKFVSFFASSSGTDTFSFAPIVNLAAGTKLMFTDNGWRNTSPIGFLLREGLVEWTAPTQGVTAGTLIRIIIRTSGNIFLPRASVNIGTVKVDEDIPNYQAFDSDLNFNLDYYWLSQVTIDGDQLFVFTGNSFHADSIKIIAGIHWNGTNWDTNVGDSKSSAKPPTLTNGTTALLLGKVSNWSTTPPIFDNTISYSIDGGQTWQTSPTFANLNPGFYRVLVKKGDCITAFAGNPVQVFACTEICGDGFDNDGNGLADCADGPCGVPAFTVTPTLPACAPDIALGNIMINLSGGGTYQYSIDNGVNWYNSTTFNNLGAGTYRVVVRNTSSGCTLSYSANPMTFSLPTCREVCNDGVDNDGDGNIDCVDTDCALVTTGFAVDVTQPTCPLGGNNGSIVISGAKNSTAAKTFFTLAPGDVAITQYDADPDQFTFVVRQPIAAGTKLIFTDKGWVNSTSGLRTQEGLAEWTAPAGGLAAGTSVTITRTNASATAGTVLFDEAIPNYAVYDSNDPNFDLSTAGDQLIALSAKSLDVSQIKQLTFLTAIQANGNAWESSATSDATSGLPPGMVNGSTARTVGKVAEANLIPYPALTPLYAFSVDGGVNFQNDSTFTNRFPGTYSIVIKNLSTGCTAPLGTNPVVLEVPTCPEICDNTLDDDGDGNADCADTDCAVPSYAVSFTQPGCPPAPVHGSITIAPYGNATDYQYSIDSGATWQSTAVFTNLNEGTYQIVVKRIASGCTLAYMPLTLQRPTCQEICNDSIDNDFDGLIDCADTTSCGIAPYAISLTQPDCPPNPIYGTISITPYSSETYQYSLNNGATWQDSTVFANVGEGTYRITIRNVASGCVETSDSMVLERPACVEMCNDDIDNDFDNLIDCADTTSCGVASFAVTASNPVFVPTQVKGSITITPSDSKAYLYSIDSGVTRQAVPTFTDLEPGAYNVFVYSGQCEEEYEDNPVFLLKPKELCDQVGDEDGDGLADCTDPECSRKPECNSATERTICYGEEIDLTFPTNDCVKWESEDFIPNSNSNAITVSPKRTTTYKIHITDDDGNLIGTHTFTVTVLPQLPVTITATEPAICEDVTSTLTANPAGYISYLWSIAGEDQIIGEEPIITIFEPNTYSVTVTDDNGCKGTASINIKSSEDVEIKIQPDPAIICAGQQIELSVPSEPGNTYQWGTTDGNFTNAPSPEKIIVTAAGTYTVTITDPNGCQYTGTAEVKSQESPEDIAQSLEDEGFVCIPITVTSDPEQLRTKKPVLEKNMETVDNQASGVQFHFQSLPGENITTEQLQTILNSRLNSEIACSTLPKGLITENGSFCESDFYQQNKGNFSESDLGIWMHLLNREGDNDCLYVKVFSSGETDVTTESLIELFNLAKEDPDNYGFASKSEQILHFTLNHVLSSKSAADSVPLAPATIRYTRDRLQFGPDQTTCQYNQPVVGLTPSGKLVYVPPGSTVEFGTKVDYRDQIDQRAITYFKVHEGDKKGTWRAHTCGGKFLGYYNVENGDYYTFDPSILPNIAALNNGVLEIQAGTYYPEPCPNNHIEVEIMKYTGAGYDVTATPTVKEPHVASFSNVESYPDRRFYAVYYCPVAISEASFDKPFAINLNPHNKPDGDTGVFGWTMAMKNSNGEVSWIYGSIDETGNITYQIYACGKWLPFDPPSHPAWEYTNGLMRALLGILYEYGSPIGHFALDAIGLVIDGADYLNAAWYIYEGNTREATLSVAFSPGAAGIVLIGSRYGVKIGTKIYNLLEFVIRYADETGQIITKAQKIDAVVNAASAAGMTSQQTLKYLNWIDDLIYTNPKLALKFLTDPDLAGLWKYADEAGLDDAQMLRLFEDLAKDGSDELIETFVSNPERIDDWVNFNNYFRNLDDNFFLQFKNPPSLDILRARAVKAMTEYPDEYVEALEAFGMSRYELFTRHGADYGDEYYEIIDNFMNANPSTLTKAEAHAIFGYTTNFFYLTLNASLRDGIDLEKTAMITNLINSALSKLPTWQGGSSVYRGIKVKGETLAERIEARNLIVDKYRQSDVSHSEFTSVGSNPDGSFFDDPNALIEIIIDLKSPSKAKDISDLADGIHYRDKPRSELLFPTESTFKVESISEPNAKGIVRIILTEL